MAYVIAYGFGDLIHKLGSKIRSLKNSSFNCITEPRYSPKSKPQPDSPFECEICVDEKKPDESFKIKGCSHFYCSDCVIRYVSSSLETGSNISVIRCPEPRCDGLLDPDHCRDILPREVFERWGDFLCQAMISKCKTINCPNENCSMVLIYDKKRWVKKAKCPYCKRSFCTRCKAPWHSGMKCEKFQRLFKAEKEKNADHMFMELAKKNKWARCPKCGFFVQKIDGCSYIKCRCGTAFCYKCLGRMAEGVHYHSCTS